MKGSPDWCGSSVRCDKARMYVRQGEVDHGGTYIVSSSRFHRKLGSFVENDIGPSSKQSSNGVGCASFQADD